MPDQKTGTTAAPPGTGRRRLIHGPRVFYPAAGLLLAFVVTTAIIPEQVGDLIAAANETVVQDLGWYYIGLVAACVFFAIWLAVSPMGSIVLGKDPNDEPEFKLGSWFAMLFAAGMGIGLVFWGVAEPLNHFSVTPPGAIADTPAAAARAAMDVTFLHWGLHAWAVYVVVGLAIAYSVHRLGNPVSIRWALRPLLGDRIKGFWGDVIDVIAVLGTLFGVATSLGLGVTQIGAGLAYLEVIDEPSTWLLVVLIIVITALAVTSVVTGVDKGIKWLSNINMGLAAAILAFVLIAGPTVFILSDFITQIGSYLQNFFLLTFNARPFQEDGAAWLGSWTTFYWGWWMSWAPFVGVFIARISKGRTIREFVMGVLLVPTLVTFLWFSVLGGSALYREIFGGGGMIAEDGTVSTDTALFQLFDTLPGSTILSVLGIALIVIFFVTSSDSASFVVDMLASGGNPDPPKWSRAFWGCVEGAVAAVLLVVGARAAAANPDAGIDPLSALQTMAILLALPFSVVLVLLAVSTAKALLREQKVRQRKQREWFAERVAEHIENRS
ncbi:choline/glycine/proline betaine transport protein [Promicromonospora umidemergens]|uniref:BCCT family transporter n=1 Tax=Promicromonospora umidemergens TaxID=629679 RepID=A0ABP8Y4Y3_9MICO|nr:BCCT family transporter [Promicromonospora umidemergens]MCP2282520.1 choline/glycine/proline betaine transport protein [Promicromonospora umidemergens]